MQTMGDDKTNLPDRIATAASFKVRESTPDSDQTWVVLAAPTRWESLPADWARRIRERSKHLRDRK